MTKYKVMVRRNDMILKEEEYDGRLYNLHQATQIYMSVLHDKSIYSCWLKAVTVDEGGKDECNM